MLQRCYYSKAYGAKWYQDIEVDPRWKSSFQAFLSDMGVKPEGYSLERLDSRRNYWAGNCIWLPMAEQQKNRSNSRMITYHCRTMCVADWAKDLGMSHNTLVMRLNRGWSVEKAFTTPLRGS